MLFLNLFKVKAQSSSFFETLGFKPFLTRMFITFALQKPRCARPHIFAVIHQK